MAQIHPKTQNNCSSEKERFTVWMKSLVLNGYGCTVYSSQGDVVFRVDNYQQRGSRKVLLMDRNGEVLFSIRRKKKVRILGCWEGYKWSGNEKQAWFEVKRERRLILRRCSSYEVRIGSDDKENRNKYRIVGIDGKSRMKILDNSGHLLAEMIEKQSNGGVALGKDVLQLIVELKVDRPLIMALITVYGLINNTL